MSDRLCMRLAVSAASVSGAAVVSSEAVDEEEEGVVHFPGEHLGDGDGDLCCRPVASEGWRGAHFAGVGRDFRGGRFSIRGARVRE